MSHGEGECYALADKIPEMAPSTEREGGFPANKFAKLVSRNLANLLIFIPQ